MDIRMESLLEDMEVNWSIIKSALEKETKKLEESRNDPGNKVEGAFSDPSHADADKIIKHQKKKDILTEASAPTNLVKKSVETRKRLELLET